MSRHKFMHRWLGGGRVLVMNTMALVLASTLSEPNVRAQVTVTHMSVSASASGFQCTNWKDWDVFDPPVEEYYTSVEFDSEFGAFVFELSLESSSRMRISSIATGDWRRHPNSSVFALIAPCFEVAEGTTVQVMCHGDIGWYDFPETLSCGEGEPVAIPAGSFCFKFWTGGLSNSDVIIEAVTGSLKLSSVWREIHAEIPTEVHEKKSATDPNGIDINSMEVFATLSDSCGRCYAPVIDGRASAGWSADFIGGYAEATDCSGARGTWELEFDLDRSCFALAGASADYGRYPLFRGGLCEAGSGAMGVFQLEPGHYVAGCGVSYGGENTLGASFYPTTITVPEEYSSIPEAIERMKYVASRVEEFNNGECSLPDAQYTIRVAPGTYRLEEPIDFEGVAIVLESIEGPDVTILDGGGAQRGMVAYSGETPLSEIRGFSFQNCTTPEPLTDLDGNGTIEWFERAGGGIVLINGSSPTIEDCVFDNCICEITGGALYIYNGSSPSIMGCTFENNESLSASGGALSIYQASADIQESTFIGNISGSTVSGGGGALVSDSVAYFLNCTFDANQAASAQGGGVRIIGTDSIATLDGCLVVNNIALAGGGVADSSGGLSIGGSEICGNSVGQIEGAYTDLGGNCVQESCDDCDLDCPADFNNDGEVNGGDLGFLLVAWNTGANDLNGDGICNGVDLGLLLSMWGPCTNP